MNDNNDQTDNQGGIGQDGIGQDGIGDAPETAFAVGEALGVGAPQPALALDDDERLPWLESADDEDEEGAIDTARVARFVAFGVALLALLVGGIWMLNHRSTGPAQVAEGGVIPAPSEPYKSEPADKGGKTFAGTGDSAFAVSEGKNPAAKLGGTETPVASAAPAAAAAAAPASPAAGKGAAAAEPASGGVGVQVGAYSSQAAAEAGWSRLSTSHEVLKGLRHRVLEGSADIGTVYRLQAVAADLAAANALCGSLKAAGVACQVKR
ncbi:SPOR domain-containing protein [Novosphingobium piscinae]|uniref:SPOR domain-containing protein n=1 Tax=Novosphingobium piscinae TaxID=1507448 RepID=A0A7X1FWM8_9SPHN|nr:SPOR domain-containing protein [Novosphingobium piscinae]MBC2668311.1 SPOR domain-containing protein [Novosphingobium piscinae]